MDIKNLLTILFAFMLTLVFVGCAANADPIKVEESSEPVIVPATETISDTSPQEETEPETTISQVETEATIETDPEDDYIFYDVPFDLDTQKEIIKICSEYDISYELVLGIISVESTFRPSAIGDGGNSFGLMQIQPRWWRKTMDREGVSDLLDPLQNIRCGCAILQYLKNTYGTEYRALQAYNTGNPNSNNGYAEKVYRQVDALTIYGG